MYRVQTSSLDHVALTVNDIKRSTEFYTRYLGFEVAVEFEPKIALSNGDVLLILAPPPDPHNSGALNKDLGTGNRLTSPNRCPTQKSTHLDATAG